MANDAPTTKLTASDSRPRILLTSPSWLDSEAEIWNSLGLYLKQRGYELCIAMNESQPHVSHIQSFYPPRLKSFESPTLWTSLPPEVGILEASTYMKRERMWQSAQVSDSNLQSSISNSYLLTANLLTVVRPKLVVMWNGELTLNMMMKSMLDKCSSKYILSERSPFPGTIYVDEQGQMSEASFCSKPTAWNSDSQKVEAIKRFQGYQDRLCKGDITWLPAAANAKIEQLEIPKDKKVIFFAGQVDSDTQNFLASPFFSDNFEAFKTLCRQLRNSGEDVFVIGKHHPRSRVSPEAFKRELGNLGVYGTDFSLDECLSKADRVVAVNSSVLFEAGMRGLPCMAMGKTLLHGQGIFYDLESANDKATVAAWLKKHDFETRQKKWLERCAWLFENHLFLSPTLDIQMRQHERVEALADQLVELADQQTPDYWRLATSATDVSRRVGELCQKVRHLSLWSQTLKGQVATKDDEIHELKAEIAKLKSNIAKDRNVESRAA